MASVKSPHPAEDLSKLIPEEIKTQLLKTPKKLMIENDLYVEKLAALRNDFKYSYMVQWIYLLKHVIKLTDAFDVENLEEEILGLAPPNFLNSLKSKLVQYLKNEKLVNIDVEFDFFADQIYKDYNMIEQNDDDGAEDDDDDDKAFITYSTAPLHEQIEILYNLIKLANSKSFATLRKNADKFEKPQLALKIYPLYTIDKDDGIREEYLILQDARLYKRTFQFSKLNTPISENDNLNYLEPKLVSWECLCCGIYQFDSYVRTLKNSFGRKYSSDEYQLAKVLEENVDFVIDHDLKKRKQSAQRKRDIEMQMLMVNRKRSSRLEEKEKRKREEEEQRMKELEIMKKNAAEMRAAKRLKLKNSMVVDPMISREERLKKRQNILEGSENEAETVVLDDQVGNVEDHPPKTDIEHSLVEIPIENVVEAPPVERIVEESPTKEIITKEAQKPAFTEVPEISNGQSPVEVMPPSNV